MSEINIPENLMVQLRRLLHKHPELSGQEEQTAQRIVGFLRSQKPTQLIEGIGGTGVAAVYQHSASPTVLVRCELDALPIQEINEFEYRSDTLGVSHKCGHDGHMSILAGLACVLGQNRLKRGRVVLLFQPAEENGMGAQAVLEDERFADIEPDYVLALHNLPGYPQHQVVCRSGSFTAAVRSIIIKLIGRTSHAGEPEMGINPALAIAQILQGTHELEVPPQRKDFALITPIQVEMGEEAYGISAGEGEVKLTLRAWDNDTMEKLCQNTEALVMEVADRHGLQVEIGWTQFFASNQNHPEMAEAVRQAALDNGFDFLEKKEPFKWGEDFGLFTERYPGAMFGLGAGEDTPALHNPDYDFPDEIAPTGVQMFKSIIDKLLQ